MSYLEKSEQLLSDEMTELRHKLAQARAALEHAHGAIASLTAERDVLLRRVGQGADARPSQGAARGEVAAGARATESATLAGTRPGRLHQANAKLEAMNAALQERVEAESSARAAAQAELFKLQKLDAVGQLTGGIAHDFNNLLTVIINGLQLLGQIRDPAHRERVLRRTEDAAWRGAHLTQRLLAFARRQALRPEWLDFTRHVESVRDLMTHGLRENIQVRTDVDPAVWPVEVDVAALELALLNLAVNARDAMPQGGTLVLSARNTVLVPAAAERLGLAPGDYVELGVADTGTGMPQELLDKVFEPFFTTKAEGKGTGLGLAQVYGFVKQSGGAAWVDSTVGVGTIVRFVLPRSLRAAPPRAPEPQAVPPAPRRNDKLKMLVVEDDDNVAALVLDMLAELGHSGTRVGTVASAMAVLTGPESVDLVFSDVLLPGGGSGLDLAREMAQRRIGVPMILTSGYGGGMTQRLAAANLPFVRKPYRMETLRQAIEDAVGRAHRTLGAA